MSYGTESYGNTVYGGAGLFAGSPYLAYSNPANGAVGVANNAPLAFGVGSIVGIDGYTILTFVNGVLAVAGLTIQPGFAGTVQPYDIGQNGADPGRAGWAVSLTTHPLFPQGTNTVTVSLKDLSGAPGPLSFVFGTLVPSIVYPQPPVIPLTIYLSAIQPPVLYPFVQP